MKNSQLSSSNALEKKRERLRNILKQYPEIKRAEVFAPMKSVENNEEADVDIMISYARGTSLFALRGLQYDIEQLFAGLNVNLMSERRYRANAGRAKSTMRWFYQQEHD